MPASLLAVAAEIDPDDPFIDYNLAGVDARSGQKPARARRELEQALAKGFRRFQLLDEDPDFAALRADPEFREWLAAARRSAAPRATTPTPSSEGALSAPSPTRMNAPGGEAPAHGPDGQHDRAHGSAAAANR